MTHSALHPSHMRSKSPPGFHSPSDVMDVTAHMFAVDVVLLYHFHPLVELLYGIEQWSIRGTVGEKN